jgi:hypothetical protein
VGERKLKGLRKKKEKKERGKAMLVVIGGRGYWRQKRKDYDSIFLYILSFSC